VNSFSAYVDELKEYTIERLGQRRIATLVPSHPQFDSRATTRELNKRLRSLIPIEDLRDSGSFFTGDEMALQAANLLLGEVTIASHIVDPACGAGNLLIACSKRLPINRHSLRSTLIEWGQILSGRDLYPKFIDATKMRLAIEALNRGAESDIEDVEEIYALFGNISTGNAMQDSQLLFHASHVIVNPPYTMTDASADESWTSGKTNAAALFIKYIADNTVVGTRISAILPDVLRSGSRYAKWREVLSSKLSVGIEIAEKFDAETDVDVFMMHGTRTENRHNNLWQVADTEHSHVGSYFNIKVGPVVDCRDPHEGEYSVFLCPKDIVVGERIDTDQIERTRRFKGRLCEPPFVAIKRTSSPRESVRSSGCIIQGDDLVAVENHVIVAFPNDGLLSTCESLLHVLSSQSTKEFLDKRIRCRHLTVSSVADIPWSAD